MPLYIATTLARQTFDPTPYPDVDPAADVRLDGQVYRPLSPDYYAYLRSLMVRARHAHEGGQLDAPSYQLLADRFNAVHADALALFGEPALLQAVRAFTPEGYRPPSADGAVDVPTLVLTPSPAAPAPPVPASARRYRDQEPLRGLILPPAAVTSRVAVGHRLRSGGTLVTVTAVHPADEDFPAGHVEFRRDNGITGQADLRYCRYPDGRPVVPMVLTADEQRVAALPDEPHDWTDADLDTSQLPEPHVYPAGDADPALRFYQPVSPRMVEMVDAIRDEALALGWTEPMLYQNRGRFAFPHGQDYGLVCHLTRGRRPGAITAQAIALVPSDPAQAILQFYHPTADQPWRQKTETHR